MAQALVLFDHSIAISPSTTLLNVQNTTKNVQNKGFHPFLLFRSMNQIGNCGRIHEITTVERFSGLKFIVNKHHKASGMLSTVSTPNEIAYLFLLFSFHFVHYSSLCIGVLYVRVHSMVESIHEMIWFYQTIQSSTTSPFPVFPADCILWGGIPPHSSCYERWYALHCAE